MYLTFQIIDTGLTICAKQPVKYSNRQWLSISWLIFVFRQLSTGWRNGSAIAPFAILTMRCGIWGKFSMQIQTTTLQRPTPNKSISGFPLSCSGWGMQILPQMLKIEFMYVQYIPGSGCLNSLLNQQIELNPKKKGWTPAQACNTWPPLLGHSAKSNPLTVPTVSEGWNGKKPLQKPHNQPLLPSSRQVFRSWFVIDHLKIIHFLYRFSRREGLVAQWVLLSLLLESR